MLCHQTCVRHGHGHYKVTHYVSQLGSLKNQVRPSLFFGWGILLRIIQIFHAILCQTVHLAPDSFHNHNILFCWILKHNSFSQMDSKLFSVFLMLETIVQKFVDRGGKAPCYARAVGPVKHLSVV